MKLILASLAVVLLISGAAFAQDAGKEMKAKSNQTEMETPVCPVSGEYANPDISYTYQHKTYHFCCEDCLAKFTREPEKYIKAHMIDVTKSSGHKEMMREMSGSNEKANQNKQKMKEGMKSSSEKTAEPAHHAEDNAVKMDMASPADSPPVKAVINTGKDLSKKIVNEGIMIKNSW